MMQHNMMKNKLTYLYAFRLIPGISIFVEMITYRLQRMNMEEISTRAIDINIEKRKRLQQTSQ